MIRSVLWALGISLTTTWLMSEYGTSTAYELETLQSFVEFYDRRCISFRYVQEKMMSCKRATMCMRVLRGRRIPLRPFVGTKSLRYASCHTPRNKDLEGAGPDNCALEHIDWLIDLLNLHLRSATKADLRRDRCKLWDPAGKLARYWSFAGNATLSPQIAREDRFSFQKVRLCMRISHSSASCWTPLSLLARSSQLSSTFLFSVCRTVCILVARVQSFLDPSYIRIYHCQSQGLFWPCKKYLSPISLCAFVWQVR